MFMPAAAASGVMRVVMLTRQDFRRRHQGRLAAALDCGRRSEQCHDRLAGSTSPCRSRSMRSARQIGGDLGDCMGAANSVSE